MILAEAVAAGGEEAEQAAVAEDLKLLADFVLVWPTQECRHWALLCDRMCMEWDSPSMKAAYRQALIERINRKDWWHVPPADPKSYEIRGKFYASTYRESEFWGHPNDTPERVRIQNPVIGDEGTVWRILFGKCVKYPGDKYPRLLEWRWALDAKMKKAAIRKGYDAIVILSTQGYRKLRSLGNVPLSIELNVLTSSGSVIP